MKVLVGMSGGVDSTASAIVLSKQGFEVHGATLPICGGAVDDSAKRACDIIGLPHHIIPIGDLFKRKVIEYFKDSIKAELTPNPCVVCNELVKLRSIFDYAIKNNFDLISTGHYAKIVDFEDKFTLSKGSDKKKDQSYMLARVPEDILKKTVLPIGFISRAEAEGLVKNLPTTPPSQDACFVTGTINEWIERQIGLGSPGLIVDKTGKILGKHTGLRGYTIGQREGIRLGGGPWYVISKNAERNELTVGHKDEVQNTEFAVTDLRTLLPLDRFDAYHLTVMTRYRASPVECEIVDSRLIPSKLDPVPKTIIDLAKQPQITFNSDLARKFFIKTTEPVFAPTPGQFAVFYVGECVVGSAIII